MYSAGRLTTIPGRRDKLQLERLRLFVAEVQVGELLAGGERPEVRGERDARQALLEVVREPGPVAGVVEDGVDVVEDVPPSQLLVLVVLTELLQRPVGETCTVAYLPVSSFSCRRL